jgi:hypothetical protein
MAERVADRAHPERLRDQALAALSTDAEKEVSAEFRRQLRQREAAPGLFDASELVASAKSGLEAAIAQNVEAGVAIDSVEATRSALRERGENYVREQTRELIADRYPKVSVVSGAVRAAFEEAALPAAMLILDGRPAPRIENRVRLDEDLRAPRASGIGI